MKEILQIETIGLLILLNSCSNKSLSNYYFPINEKSEIKVYKFIDPKNIEPGFYWRTKTNPSKATLITESINSDFQLYNTFEEQIKNGKAQLINYVEYEENNSKEIIAAIKEHQVFDSDKSKTYSYKVEYKNKYGKMTSKKKRKFLGFETIEVQGKKYKTAKFKDEYFIELIDLNEKFGFDEICYYAKGIGMIKSERFIETNEVITKELEKILTDEEFNKIKNKASR
ncbi:MAG: hypothetical protein AB8F94_21500 [Saprospiraceae bacterium]